MSSFSVVSAVICEDVRREASGQATIVGASPVGPAIAPNGGNVHSIAFFIEIIAENLRELDVRLINEDLSVTVFERSLQLPIDLAEGDEGKDWEAHTLLVLAFHDLKFPSAGEYRLQARDPKGEWKEVRRVFCPESED